VARRDRWAARSTIGDLSDPALIATLTGWLERAGASALELTTATGGALKIALDAGTCPVLGADPMPGSRIIKAPLAGRFHDRHPAATEAAPLAGAGRVLAGGAIAGFVAVGPILLPVLVPEGGVVSAVHVRAGDLIGDGAAIVTMAACR